MLIPLMALLSVLFLVTGIILIVLRRRGKRIRLSREESETAKILRDAFGDDMKWGGAGGTESEMHDHGSHDNHTDGHI
jgi:hypothetical protein